MRRILVTLTIIYALFICTQAIACDIDSFGRLSISDMAELRSVELSGSMCSVLFQNFMADALGIGVFDTDSAVEKAKEDGVLQAMPAGSQREAEPFNYHPQFNERRRWLRPEALNMALFLGNKFREKFGYLPINSAVRSAEFQNAMRSRNSNAISASGLFASLHPRGIAFDIGKYRYPLDIPAGASSKTLQAFRTSHPDEEWKLSEEELEWLREELLFLEHVGLIDVTEENMQAVFHVTVFYDPAILFLLF